MGRVVATVRVLVAHLDPETLERVREWLAPFGYAVDAAHDVDGVRAAVRDEPYDVALVATDLCRGDGAGLLRDIKTGPAGHTTAVILIDRNLEYDDAMNKLDRGAHDFLLEPLNPAELVARVQSAHRLVSLQQELLGQSRRLESLVYQDALTGLNNRRFMLVQLSALISGARRHGRPVSVVMIDLDHFKALNDTYGHEAGDHALVAVSRAIKGRLRAEDYVGRMGGEEFLALLPDTGPADAAAVAESLRLCASEAEIVTADGDRVTVTASAGWATWEGESPEGLIRRADRALYAAKAAGRDLVRGG